MFYLKRVLSTLPLFLFVGFVGCTSVTSSPRISTPSGLTFRSETSQGIVSDNISVFVQDQTSGVEKKIGSVTLSLTHNSETIHKRFEGRNIQVQCRAVDKGGTTDDSCLVYVNGTLSATLR
jgi:hypothetical protein